MYSLLSLVERSFRGEQEVSGSNPGYGIIFQAGKDGRNRSGLFT